MLVIDGWTYNELTDGTPTSFIAPCRCCCDQNHASAFGCDIYEAVHMITAEIYVCSYCYVRLKNKKMVVREIAGYLRPTPTNEKPKRGMIAKMFRDLESQADDIFPDDVA